jgi:exopolyphosphatase / guanosine-5'-triphosphate,3'-diphosphate pyrophosphatase
MKTKIEHNIRSIKHIFRSFLKPRKAEKLAVIDMGTNTFHLMIVTASKTTHNNPHHHFNIVHKEKVNVMIGKNGLSEGKITEDAQIRMFEALTHFKKIMTDFNVSLQNTQIMATSAIRNAKNQTEILNKIKKELNFEVEVLSGQDEAQYIYYGVKTAIKIGKATTLIMDIGGGSVEFIICNDQKVFWKQSFEIGAQRLLDKFMAHDPILPQELLKIEQYLEVELIALTNAVHQYAPEALIGSSGAFDTIDEINLRKKTPDLQYIETVSEFSRSEFQEIFKDLSLKTRYQRLQISGMAEMRVDMIVVASALLDFVLRKYMLENVRVSPYSLKEGLLSKHLGWTTE